MATAAMAVPAPETEKQLHSPPDSHNDAPSLKHDASDSELSDLEDPEEDMGEVEPEYYADDGRVPVFKPNMAQFKSFSNYMKKINSYGMKSGIVKVIPPPEWRSELPSLDEAIKTIRVKEPIKQDIMGTSGTYRQANILHQRSYNLPQWRQLCEQSEHQPPAKRGERRLNQEKPKPITKPIAKPKGTSTPTGSKKKGAGRPARGKAVKLAAPETEDGLSTPDRLPTPVSPSIKPDEDGDLVKHESDDEDGISSKPKGGRQPKAISVSSRRKYNRREAAAKVDEEAFKDFKYELDGEDYTPERCEELERAYWKTLTYAPPLYGADMPGSLFDDRTTSWNLGKLENLLDIMGTKIPGVNTAYLYLGMWKATFAWHLEDVDLYSINYLHFGAPKQWYSISQGDARRFEAAMKTIWPTDAKACDQFLRHKTFLISPSHLLQNFNIKVNKIVHHPGEFVITFPYGYHSGYNLGYNCAEAVNFALDSWLEYGRVAKKCDCAQAQDSVWIDVREIERKLRGEETDFEETDEEEDEEEDEEPTNDLLTPPDSNGENKVKAPKKKRKRPTNEKGEKVNLKRIRVRIKAPTREPCILCPNDIPSEPLLPTEEGETAHRMCALYIPETSIESGEKEIITDVKYINKARLELKCNYCRSKKGACFQCSQKKCTRAYHATCAAAAGVLVEQGEVPVFGEDGTEYKEWGIEFSCRFHRSKRDKKYEANDLSEMERIRKAGLEFKVGDICQAQYYRADIFAGAVVENHKSEEMLLIDILPRGDRVEVEYKWLLIPQPSDFHLQKPSANAIPMPKSFKAKESLNTSKRQADDLPRADDPFVEGCIWAEFKNEAIARNPNQVKIDFNKENQIWYYLGKKSTEAKAQFTEDLAKPRHNPKGHFLDTIPKPTATVSRQSYAASYPSAPSTVNQTALNASKISNRPAHPANSARPEKPYVYKPRECGDKYRVDQQAYLSQQNFLQRSSPAAPALAFGTDPRYRPSGSPTTTTPNPYPKYTSAYPNNHSTPSTNYPTPPTKYFTPSTSYPTPSNYSTPPTVPPVPRGILAPPAPYRPGLAPPLLQPPKQNNPFSGRARPNPFAKYAYLQKEHNRSPLEYKSPYRPGGGFMNGYQGNLEKHLQQTMLQNRTASATPLLSYGSNQKMQSPSQSSFAQTYNSMAPSNHGSYGSSNAQKCPTQPAQHQVAKMDSQNSWEKNHPQSRSVIQSEYNSDMYHNHALPQPSQHSNLQSPVPASSHERYTPQTQQKQQSHQNSPMLQPPQYSPPYQTRPDYSPAQTSYPENSFGSKPNGASTSHLTYQAPPVPYQDTKPVYAHQQYFQKPAQSQMYQMQGHQNSIPLTQTTEQRDFPDVPADSTSIIERVMQNLKKVTKA